MIRLILSLIQIRLLQRSVALLMISLILCKTNPILEMTEGRILSDCNMVKQMFICQNLMTFWTHNSFVNELFPKEKEKETAGCLWLKLKTFKAYFHLLNCILFLQVKLVFNTWIHSTLFLRIVKVSWEMSRFLTSKVWLSKSEYL